MTVFDKIQKKLKAAPSEVVAEVLALLEARERAKTTARQDTSNPVSWDDFMGALNESRIFSGDPVEIQRKLRDEWTR
jgi:hypothetical protein